jgi:hypothetical protein
LISYAGTIVYQFLSCSKNNLLKMIKRWVEIDPGLAIIGWAIIEDHKPKEPLLLHYGTIKTHNEISTPTRLLEIAEEMTAIAACVIYQNVTLGGIMA